MKLTFTEENYLKAIYSLPPDGEGRLSNLAIAERLGLNPPAVTEMLRRLRGKRMIEYTRKEGAKLTKTGAAIAVLVVRKHRLWETFLVRKMGFKWDEVHEVAEQMEHIQSDLLIERLDRLLDYPRFDPHGDPIPDKNGKLPDFKAIPLADGVLHRKYKLAGVAGQSRAFLQFLDKIDLSIDDSIEIQDIREFDRSMNVLLKGKLRTIFSAEVSRSLLVV
jgi:DtxR family Mn-dependent transcriptional regulator